MRFFIYLRLGAYVDISGLKNQLLFTYRRISSTLVMWLFH